MLKVPHAVEPSKLARHNYLACVPKAYVPDEETPPVRGLCTTRKRSTHSPQLEKARAKQRRPTQPKIHK